MIKKLTIPFIALLLAGTAFFPVRANSITDGDAITWTVIRDFNKNSGGWDLVLMTNDVLYTPIQITSTLADDTDEYLACHPYTNNKYLVWAAQGIDGYRIYYSMFDGENFTTPEAVNENGEGFSDTQPYLEFDLDGIGHLVWFRQYDDGTTAALYAQYDGRYWSHAQKISLPLDQVVGTVTISVDQPQTGMMEATYLYVIPSMDIFAERRVCRGGDTHPWANRWAVCGME